MSRSTAHGWETIKTGERVWIKITGAAAKTRKTAAIIINGLFSFRFIALFNCYLLIDYTLNVYPYRCYFIFNFKK